MVETSAYIFVSLSAVVIIFQACLAAGAPWGTASMGGKYPGKYPPKMRVVAVVNILVLSLIAIMVLAKAGVAFKQFESWSDVGIWVAVVFSGIGTVLNTITPSKIERIWVPLAATQLITSIIIATG